MDEAGAVDKPKVVLGVSGGIAAYKACELLRRLTESGHDVRVVPTASALHFVGAATWSALSGNPVSTEVWDRVHEVPHVRIGQARRPRRRRPRHRRHARQGRPRPRRRPAHQHPAHRPLSGGLRPRHAHRDVGAPGHPGERGHAAPPRRRRHRARRRPAHRRRHRQGPAARPGRDLRGLPPGAGPRRRAPSRTWPAAMSSSARAAPASRSTRSATSATAPPASRATPSPVRPPPAAPGSRWSPPTPRCPTRRAWTSSTSARPCSCARPCSRPPRTPTPW